MCRGVLRKLPQTDLLKMKTPIDIEEALKEIASFYDDTEGAMRLLKRKEVDKMDIPNLTSLLEGERSKFEKRKKNNIASDLFILELALDTTSVVNVPGHSLGLAAYQAEMRYQG